MTTGTSATVLEAYVGRVFRPGPVESRARLNHVSRMKMRPTYEDAAHVQPQSENSFASSTHSPFGASNWYARQCGRASCEWPIFSSVTAR